MSEFAQLLQREDFAIEEAALLLAKEVAYADLDIQRLLFVLDESSLLIRAQCKTTDTIRQKLQRINQFLFEDLGIEGNTNDYYNPRNSFLNDVLRLNKGIPITLSILYMAIAKRLELPVYGVGLPGHFLVGCQEETDIIYLDPFNGGLILSEAECQQIAAKYLPAGVAFSPAFLHPQPNRLILARMLTNLRQIYLQNNDSEHLLRVLFLQKTLNPSDPDLSRDIGVIYARLEQWGQARQALWHYLAQRPTAEDAQTVQSLLNQIIEHISKLN